MQLMVNKGVHLYKTLHVSPFVGKPVRLFLHSPPATTLCQCIYYGLQKEIGKAMKMGGDVQEYLYAAIMLPATELEVAKDLMGTAMLLQSSTFMPFAADC